MLVRLGHPEPTNGLSLEVELDQHCGLVSHDPPVVPRLNRDDLWSYELRGAAICVLNMDSAAGRDAGWNGGGRNASIARRKALLDSMNSRGIGCSIAEAPAAESRASISR